ncbi:MAG: Crp/Fnr family transcriptional regulator [Desulfuromonas sp.]|nr:MAG: Crp/Fnr family transcriptional regulator [Desulfuromonas sp.]
MKLSESIKKCRLFTALKDADIELLTAICKQRVVNKGEILFEEGEPAVGFYIVAEGKVKVYKLSAEGRERILHVILPGNSFADAAIFDNCCYPAFAEALTQATLIFFPKNDFLDLLHNHSQLAINMIAGLSRYLRVFAGQIEDLTFRDVPARLARFLTTLVEGESTVVVLPLSKSQLASNLGTTSETLSRTLRKLADEELISVQGKNIDILDLDRLHDLAAQQRINL